DALYAFTECEQSISCNFLVIKDDKPELMTVPEVVKHHAERLLGILKRELELEAGELADELHARTLERVFIEERVYKGIEKMKTAEGVRKAVIEGLEPFKKEIRRAVTDEDVERLLKIPIRRISLYDINKAKEEMDLIKAKLAEVRKKLANLVDYAVSYLEAVAKRLEPEWKRRTELARFSSVDVKEAARRDLPLRYDGASGYLGTAVSGGETLFEVSPYDKVIAIRRNGVYTAMTVPEKLFVDQGLLYCGSADKERLAELLFTVVYREKESGYPYIKRCRIETYINNRDYQLVPDGAQILLFSTEADFSFTVAYAPKPRMKVKEEGFVASDYEEKGLKALGSRLASKEALSAELGISKAAARAAAAAEKAQAASELFPAGRAPSLKKKAAEAKKSAAKAKPKAKGGRASPPKADSARGLRARAEAAKAKAGKKPGKAKK
ncbi:MAG TPA: DNA gyrase subunit A, partial [Spirochaetales bacterium]|nr:DNA gyrase subunit A [Spirochaetales bacterium]